MLSHLFLNLLKSPIIQTSSLTHNQQQSNILMRQQLVHTNRHLHTNQSQAVIEVIPRNDRVQSPRNDKSLQRRSKSLRSSDFPQLSHSIFGTSQTHINVVTSATHRNHENELIVSQMSHEMNKSMSRFIADIEKLKSENRQLVSENELLVKQNQLIRNSMEHDIRQSKFSRQSDCSINDHRNGYLESYYSRIKAIQQRVEYYQAESKANEMYSNCLLEISKCLSSEQLSISQLKSKILNLMEQCQSYKDQLKRLDEMCRMKEHNTNEELQKIIMDFNETVFIKNELEIKIFDLTTENNTLRTNIYELNHQLDEQLLEIDRMNHQLNNLNTNLSTSQYPHQQNDMNEGYGQLRLNYEHLDRENQHLKLEIGTYKTKIQHYHGSQFNHKQEISRLNNFVSQLNTKWNVQFQHNGVLQQQRKNHLRQIARLSSQIQRLGITLQQTRKIQANAKHDIDIVLQEKRGVEREIEILRSQLSRHKSGSMEISQYNQNLENEVRDLNNKLARLNDTMNEINRINQNKENNYLHELNSLREQIQKLKHQCQVSNESLISKQEEIRMAREEGNQNSSQMLQYYKSEARLEIERERSHNKILNEKIKELEVRIETMHKQGLQLESELSSKRMAIVDLQNSLKIKHSESDERIRRMENAYNLELEKTVHNKSLLEGELILSKNHIRELEQSMYRMKENQINQNQNLNSNNSTLQRRIDEYELTLQNMRNRILCLEGVEMEKNKIQIEYNQLERQLNNRSIEMETFMKKTQDEQLLRRECYESEIISLQQFIRRNEEEKNKDRREHESQMISMTQRQVELENNLMKQTIQLEQESRSQSQFRMMVQQLKQQLDHQLENLKNELIMTLQHQYKQKGLQSSNQFDITMRRYEDRLNNVADALQKMIRTEGKNRQSERKNMEEWINVEIRTIRERFSEDANKTRRFVGDFVQNQRTAQKSNNNKIYDIQNKIKAYENMLHQLSFQRTARANKQHEVNHKNMLEFQILLKQNDNLKLTNNKLSSLLATNQQTIITLRSQLTSWSNRYDKLKSDSQHHQDILRQQIRSYKTSIVELEKHNIEFGTKATFTEHDKTIDRMTSMHDLNRSLIQNNKSLNDTGRIININPQILLVDESNRLKTFSNKIVQRASSPGTQVVVNVIQKGAEQEQKMIQPSNTVRNLININRTLSPKNDGTFNILPLIMNQEPASPTHRFCYATKRTSVSPPLVRPREVSITKHTKKQSILFDRQDETKMKQIPQIPIQRNIYSPKANITQSITSKVLSPSVNPQYLPPVKSQTPQPLIYNPPTNFIPKPTSPNPKEGKLSVTLLHNNSLIGKPRQRSKDKMMPPPPSQPSSMNSDMKYCC